MESKEEEGFSSGTSRRMRDDPEVDGDCEGDPAVESDPGVVVLEAIGERDPGVVVLEARGEREGDKVFGV